jgi:hypothetical protein
MIGLKGEQVFVTCMLLAEPFIYYMHALHMEKTQGQKNLVLYIIFMYTYGEKLTPITMAD